VGWGRPHSPALPLASALLSRKRTGLRMVALLGAHLMFLSASARVLPLALRLLRVRQVRFCRYRFCATGELKYRGAVGLGYRSTYKRTLFVIIRFYC
jgi:hypothetical protein